MSPGERLVQRLVDPRYREELLGDLAELRARRSERLGRRAARRRHWRDLTSVCLYMSRARRDAAGTALTVVAALILAVAIMDRAREAAADPGRYTVSATDPYGAFTIEIERGRVRGATLDGEPVAPGAIRQTASRVVIAGGAGGRDFELALKPEGGITWTARPARPAAVR